MPPLTVMYIKVYISGMEMSQRIHFVISNFTKNALGCFFFFGENGKKSIFW